MDSDSNLDSPNAAGLDSPNPLKISVVIDVICSFLPKKDLPQLRGVSREWKMSCIRILRNLPNYTHINFIGDSDTEEDRDITEYAKFVDTRDRAVDWYEERIKYSLQIGSCIPEQEFASAEKLVERFGPACLKSLTVELHQEANKANNNTNLAD